MSNGIVFNEARIWCSPNKIRLQEEKIKRHCLLRQIHDECHSDFGAWGTLVLFSNISRLNLGKHKKAKGLSLHITFDFDMDWTTVQPEDYLQFCISDHLGHEIYEKIEVIYNDMQGTYEKAMSLLNKIITERSNNYLTVSPA